jgi:branched-subunit amino acid aminotransferase/4-amino-4-deoxychorismate lyase
MKKYCYCNGEIVLEEDARIHPRDLGYLRGYAVFDVMLVKNGIPFLFHEHWMRLTRSAEELLMPLPMEQQRWREIIEELHTKVREDNFIVRTVVSGGCSADSMTLDVDNIVMTVLIEEYKPYPSEAYANGVSVITQEFQRQNPAVKSTNYMFPVRLQNERVRQGATEIVYVLNGLILEASTSNIFLVKNNVLVSPAHNVLWGTTRNLVIRLAKENDIPVEERNIVFEELFESDEAFITASNKEVMPVVKIDEIKLGSGKVGYMTKKIMSLYQAYQEQYKA